MHRFSPHHCRTILAYRTPTALVPLLGILLLFLLACRSGPPPPTASDQLASRRQEATGQYQDVVIIDAQCSSFASKDDQIVCIANKGKDSVKMGKWLVRNTIGRTYYFPDSTVLDPGKSIHLHTGAGTNSPTDLYWNYEFKPVFDIKDQISLVDASNVVVAKFTTP
jgi:micrococcal nuclease